MEDGKHRIKILREEGFYFLTFFHSAPSYWDLAIGKLAKLELTSLSPKLSCSWHASHQITIGRLALFWVAAFLP
jgi:hypothetical protein